MIFIPRENILYYYNYQSEKQLISQQNINLLCFINFQVAHAQAEEASNMRKRLNDENFTVAKPSHATSPLEANAKVGQASKRTAADIAAEVADKLTASSSSQLIMTSVLSTFAAEEAKNAGLTKTSTVSNSFTPMPSNSKPENSMPVSDPNVFMSTQTLTAPPNQPYQSVIIAPPTMQSQTPTSQTQYHMLPNPPSQQYLQPSGGIMNPYGYGSIPPLPPGPPPPPSTLHMVNPMAPLPQQQSIPLVQQPALLTHHQPMPLTQQPPAPPSFRPLQLPGMVYYGLPHHSQ